MLVLSEVTDEEFAIIRPHFEVKAQALGTVRRFVDKEGVINDIKIKNWFWAGYDKSKYIKAIIRGEVFIVAAGNVIAEIVSTVLPDAAQKYSSDFGTRDAHSVVAALARVRPIPFRTPGEDIEKFFSTEQFAFCFRLQPNRIVDNRVLRLDLFRLIQEEKNNAGKFEFTGGIMHLLKHFKHGDKSLSTSPGEYQIQHPTDLVSMIIQAFFQSELQPKGKS